MSLENVRQRVVDLKKECDTSWTLTPYEHPMVAQSEAYQQVLDIIDEELKQEGVDGETDAETIKTLQKQLEKAQFDIYMEYHKGVGAGYQSGYHDGYLDGYRKGIDFKEDK